MGRIIECMGRYALNPYYLEKVYYRVFSVEELCYYFCENTDLLEKDIVNANLANWLETECGLRELSNKLYKVITTGGSLAQFVITVLDYVQFCSPSELRQIEARLSENGGMNPLEKRKKRADYFLKNQRYALAITEYEALLKGAPEEASEFKAELYHAMGVANANMFLFEKASTYFMKAFELDADDRHYFGYLAALRFTLSDMDFIRKVGENPHMSAQALKLEEKLEKVNHEWMESTLFKELVSDEESHEKGDTTYYSQTEEKVQKWMEEYRLITSE